MPETEPTVRQQIQTVWARRIDDDELGQAISDCDEKKRPKPRWGDPQWQASGFEGEEELWINYKDPKVPNRLAWIPEPRRMPNVAVEDEWRLWKLPRLDPLEATLKSYVRDTRLGGRKLAALSYLFHHHPSHCAFFEGNNLGHALSLVLDGPEPWIRSLEEQRPAATPDEHAKLYRLWRQFCMEAVSDGLIEIWEAQLLDHPDGHHVYIIQIAPIAYNLNNGIWFFNSRGRLLDKVNWDNGEKRFAVDVDSFQLLGNISDPKRKDAEVTPEVIEGRVLSNMGIAGTLDNMRLDEDAVAAHDLQFVSKLDVYHPGDHFRLHGAAFTEIMSLGGMPVDDGEKLRACLDWLNPNDLLFVYTHISGLPSELNHDGVPSLDALHGEYLRNERPQNSLTDKVIEAVDMLREEGSQHVAVALLQLRRKVGKILKYQIDVANGLSPDGSERV